MRRFCKIAILFAVVSVVSIITVRILWILTSDIWLKKNVLPEATSTIIIGNSVTEHGLNDSLMYNTVNLSLSAGTYSSMYSALIWANEFNNTRIDTVVAVAGVFSFLEFQDSYIRDCYYLQSNESYGILDYKDYFDFYKYDPEYYLFILKNSPFNNMHSRVMGGRHDFLVRNKVTSPEAAAVPERCVDDCGGYDSFTLEYILRNCSFQVKYFRKIRDYVRNNNLTLILVNMPYYHVENFVSECGFKEFLLNEFGEEQLIADYCHYVFPKDHPDTLYYGDIEHINHLGCEYLTKDIVDNGWKLQTLKDYCGE